ncbi:2202_t:CDS:2 [Acaulospora morrowiae]|uniref:2202_t:CDS:1 n=1 Tax=Acaulospora morrowiae TaxID=94023 RepID=A0A9N9E140_9GLOM|nr:2202_t:CDS:2 [Acaulospora morrowiae]
MSENTLCNMSLNKHNNNVINERPIPETWLKRKCKEWDPSLVLANTASVARDHLANERTFLAWLRTSLSFIGIGVAITQLFRLTDSRSNDFSNIGKPLGIVFIILGIVFLLFGLSRYFHSQNMMTQGQFPASRGAVVIGAILTILALLSCFIIIIIIETKN